MNEFFIGSALLIITLMIASMHRGIVGPTVLDRILSVNAIGSKTTVLLVLIGFMYHRVEMFVDIALAYGMLNFIAVIAAAKYFHKRRGQSRDVCMYIPPKD